MHWFHPLGGPVLLLPASIAPKWRGQDPASGFTRFYESVRAAVEEPGWVGLDIGGLALADGGPIAVQPVAGGVRFVVVRRATTQDKALERADDAEVAPLPNRAVPWPGGSGLLFDAIENGATLDGGLTEPHEVELPSGPLQARIGTVNDDDVDLLIVEIGTAA